MNLSLIVNFGIVILTFLINSAGNDARLLQEEIF
jgi:hypothetical protein